jgi:oligosaccharyl transferase (archaeosortase A-associated)
MTPILQVLQNIIPAQDNLRAKLPRMARFGIAALLIVIAFIIFIFQAQFLMRYMFALLPVFYVVAVLAVGAKKALYGTAVFLFFCFALWIRVALPYNYVLGGSYVNFQTNDAEYHMRLIENLVQHFPRTITFDPYTQYPTGEAVPFAPFYGFLIGFFIWIAGLGHPSLALTDVMAAYYPAVLGALVVIPVYFIGRELFNNRNAGLLASGLIAILPGEFLERSLLGNTDHHVAEALFSTVVMMFLIMAIKRAQELSPTFSSIKNRDWSKIKKPLIFSTLAGLILEVYILTWIGAALFVGIVGLYFVFQYTAEHLKGRSTDYLFIVGVPFFLVGLLLSAPFLSILLFGGMTVLLVGLGLVAVFGMSGLSRLMIRFNMKKWMYPCALALVLGLGVLIVYLGDRSLFNDITGKLGVFKPSTLGLTIGEVHPLLEGFNVKSIVGSTLWNNSTTCFVLAPIAFLTIVYLDIKEHKFGKWLFLGWIVLGLLTIIINQVTLVPWQLYVAEGFIILLIYFYCANSSIRKFFMLWSIIILVAAFGQVRFCYYLSINLALLSCYILWQIPAMICKVFQFAGWKETLKQDAIPTRAAKKRQSKELEKKRAGYLKPTYVSGFLSIIAVFFLVLYPNLLYGTSNHKSWSPHNSVVYVGAKAQMGAPDNDWYTLLTWMKNNTPDPFGNDSFYYNGIYTNPANGSYPYPSTAYGVMSWWDYGHAITTIAHRIPNANPFQSGIGGIQSNGSILPGASTFLVAQDETNGSTILDTLGSKYVIINYMMAGISYNSIFGVIPVWAGQNQSDYSDVWYYSNSTSGGYYYPMVVVYPQYYQAMSSRLYNFGGQAVVPSYSTWALKYTDQEFTNGGVYRILTGSGNGFNSNGEPLPFATYDEAAQYVASNPGYVIVGMYTFVGSYSNYNAWLNSAVPLEALSEYKLIYSSPTTVAKGTAGNISEVELFEYTGYKH